MQLRVQIGGNDIGFSEIIQQCSTPLPLGTPCRDRYTNAMLAAQAAAAGATYVDTCGPSIGHHALGMRGMASVLAAAMAA